MSIVRTALLGLALLLAASCAPQSARVVTTSSPGVERIPTAIALHPLLTAPTEKPLGYRALRSAERGRELYLTPPAASELTVTLQSQLMTDLLSAELAYRGFALKELPFEAVDTGGDAKGTFAVSLDLLEALRAETGLEAILVGNVYLARDRYAANGYAVRAAHCKLVDIETLDILCHISIPPSDPGGDMTAAVETMAAEMARLAGLDAP